MKHGVEDIQMVEQGASDEWCVTLCQCGRVTLQVGEIQQRFTSQQFAQLHRLVNEAMRVFQFEPIEADAQAPFRSATTH